MKPHCTTTTGQVRHRVTSIWPHALTLILAAALLAGCAAPHTTSSIAETSASHAGKTNKRPARQAQDKAALVYSGTQGMLLGNLGITGLASYYGQRFAGELTASGERFDPTELTAAHRTLPFGTRVLVTNLSNGRQVTVRINDRGPYVEPRIIDLSRRAAEQLRMIRDGVARVRIRVLE